MRAANQMVLIAALAAASCAEPSVGVPSPGTLQEPALSPGLFAAAVQHLARNAHGRVLVDPRPLRRGADLAGIHADDLASDADEITRMRTDVLAAHDIAQTDATVDQRCTFSHGLRAPEWMVARVPDSVRVVTEACRAREPYTTFILSLPERVEKEGYPSGTWLVRAHTMYQAGFELWDLHLRPAEGASWQIVGAERTFKIQS